MTPGQIITCKGIPLRLLGDIQVQENGKAIHYIIVELENGMFVKNELHVKKFLLLPNQIDGMNATDVEVV